MNTQSTGGTSVRVIRRCGEGDFDDVLAVVNDGAEAYRGVIPVDCWHEPYMSAEDFGREIAAGVTFWGIEEDGAVAAVMGLQRVDDVDLIRHAYVRGDRQRRGLGGELLRALCARADRPLLVGTWAAATWAIDFYAKHGFEVVPPAETAVLLRRYWSIPERQIETSVVLADAAWRARRPAP